MVHIRISRIYQLDSKFIQLLEVLCRVRDLHAPAHRESANSSRLSISCRKPSNTLIKNLVLFRCQSIAANTPVPAVLRMMSNWGTKHFTHLQVKSCITLDGL